MGSCPRCCDALNELTTTLGANCGCFVDGSERVQRWSTDRAFTSEEISVIRAHCATFGHEGPRCGAYCCTDEPG
jgi:hypothetical protein